jgi:DNA polymerase III delta prime subunit
LFAGGTSDGSGAKSDPYRSAVVDTIVAEVQSTPGEDRCVLLLGYKDQMQKMFQNVNPGLSRRFPIDQAFEFEDFTEDELDKILTLKLKQQGFGITYNGRKVVLEMLERARNRPHFGNAGEVDILLNSAKMHYQKRLSSSRTPIDASSSVFDAEDFDEDHDRAERDDTNIAMLFEGVVGCEEIIAKLEENRQMVKKLKQMKMNPREQVPFNFLFRGPPGTGKTSTARKMGKVYYDMGLLASAEVVEASATDLVGQYVGQTGPKTQSLLETALGKVLFIDEAYRLADGPYGKEAMDELVDCITKPEFAQRLIIILAGYDSEINQLMSTNPGLTSRFPESIQFKTFSPPDCFELLQKLFEKRKKELKDKGQADIDLAVLECPSHDFKESLSDKFDRLSKMDGWANARDVGSLAKGIFKRAISASNGRTLALTEEMVLGELDSMIKERSRREKVPHKQHSQSLESLVQQQFNVPIRQASNQAQSTTKTEKNEETADTKQSTDVEPRDVGVTDEVWNQLQRDKLAAEAREKEWLRLKAEEEAHSKHLLKLKQDEERAINELKEAQRKHDEEARVRLEQARLKHEMERRQQEAILEKIRKEKEAREEARRKEQKAQEKLRKMGVCVMGYRWIKQSGGYRCSAGGHWVSDAQLE